MLIKKFQALFYPEQYHGWGKNKTYFEGWYYKIINASGDKAFAFIPGIAMGEKGNKQAFIQVLDGINLTAEYHTFGAEEFDAVSGRFEINIARNNFTTNAIELDLQKVKGKLIFRNQVPWPNEWYSPGIMGPFTFVPFMECYHGILSMDHAIEGQLSIHDEVIDFTNGRGYIEKDWGHSFPSAYIWMQSNHFGQPGISVKASVAKIPWLGSSFVGFIAGVWVNNQLIQFTTYNSTKLRKSWVDNEKVEMVMENKKYRLEILAHRHETTELASPILGFMEGRINESMTSRIDVELFDKRNKRVLFQGTGRNTGLEVAGNVHEILVG